MMASRALSSGLIRHARCYSTSHYPTASNGVAAFSYRSGTSLGFPRLRHAMSSRAPVLVTSQFPVHTRSLSSAATEPEQQEVDTRELPETTPLRYLKRGSSKHMAYHVVAGESPTIVYCHGFQSAMKGIKSRSLEEYCREHQLGFLKFDFTGCGASGGNIKDVTFTDWRNDLLTVIDYITAGPLVLIGSNVATWVMLSAAVERPHRLHSIIGISSAPDLPTGTVLPLSEQQATQLEAKGHIQIDIDGYKQVLSTEFMKDAEQYKILEGNQPIPLRCPVRLLHGLKDAQVPALYSRRLAEKIQSADVVMVHNKSADHHFRQPADIQLIIEELDYLVGGSWDARNLSIVSWSNFAVYNTPEQLI